jgi:hypothetical protein
MPYRATINLVDRPNADGAGDEPVASRTTRRPRSASIAVLTTMLAVVAACEADTSTGAVPEGDVSEDSTSSDIFVGEIISTDTSPNDATITDVPREDDTAVELDVTIGNDVASDQDVPTTPDTASGCEWLAEPLSGEPGSSC